MAICSATIRSPGREGRHHRIFDEPDARRALADGDGLFASPDDLTQITADWPSARLVLLWNGIPGVAPIKKFPDRPTALKRIWAAIKALEPVHQPTTDVRPSEGGPSTARPGTKKAIVLELLSRSEGASVHEIMAALGWQSHSVRGYLSSLSKQGTGIHSFRRSDGDHAYSINTETESKAEGAQRVARTHPAWILKKGGEDCIIAERIRLSPVPWLGGWAGKQLRFLSVSRGQSILTDVQQGSLALNRRVTGLPLMQRMWLTPAYPGSPLAKSAGCIRAPISACPEPRIDLRNVCLRAPVWRASREDELPGAE